MKINVDIGYKGNVLYENVKVIFPENGVVSFIGDNGSGKSTIHKTLLGAISPVRGIVPEEFSKRCAIVSDYVHIPEEVRVRDVLKLVDRHHLEIAKNKYINMTRYVYDLKNQLVKKMSSGQKRIVEIYIALASGKDVILLDEAANSLDYKNRVLFLSHVKELSKENVLFIHTSHDLSDVEYLGGEVYGFFKEKKCIEKYLNQEFSSQNLKNFLGYEV